MKRAIQMMLLTRPGEVPHTLAKAERFRAASSMWPLRSVSLQLSKCRGGTRKSLVSTTSEAELDLDPTKPFVALDSFDLMTGFTPIHAVIAIGLDDMVEFLLDLPDDVPGLIPWSESARRQLRSPIAIQTAVLLERQTQQVSVSIPRGLTPLQLAVHLGHKAVVMRLLRRQMSPLWQWGARRRHLH